MQKEIQQGLNPFIVKVPFDIFPYLRSCFFSHHQTGSFSLKTYDGFIFCWVTRMSLRCSGGDFVVGLGGRAKVIGLSCWRMTWLAGSLNLLHFKLLVHQRDFYIVSYIFLKLTVSSLYAIGGALCFLFFLYSVSQVISFLFWIFLFWFVFEVICLVWL